MIRMVTVQTQFIFQNCIEPEGTFSQTGSQIIIQKIMSSAGVINQVLTAPELTLTSN